MLMHLASSFVPWYGPAEQTNGVKVQRSRSQLFQEEIAKYVLRWCVDNKHHAE